MIIRFSHLYQVKFNKQIAKFQNLKFINMQKTQISDPLQKLISLRKQAQIFIKKSQDVIFFNNCLNLKYIKAMDQKTKLLKKTLIDMDNLRQKHYEDTTDLEQKLQAALDENNFLKDSNQKLSQQLERVLDQQKFQSKELQIFLSYSEKFNSEKLRQDKENYETGKQEMRKKHKLEINNINLMNQQELYILNRNKRL